MQSADAAQTRKLADGRHFETQILSVVCVVNGHETWLVRGLSELHEAVASLGTSTELVAVLNGCSTDGVNALRALAARCPCLQVYVIKRRLEYSIALLAGVENAVGDWIATIDAEADDPGTIRKLYEAATRGGADVALSVAVDANRGLLDRLVSRSFHWCFRRFNGFDLADEAPSARLLSRAVVNSFLSDDAPLIAFETLTARGGYRRCVVPTVRRRNVQRSWGDRVRSRWRTLIGMNAAPLRLANLFSGLGAAAALSYSLYVLIVYLSKHDVVPGWTTLSLMMSGMFMTFTLVLWLLSEYMLMLLDPGSRRPHYEIADEFRGGAPSFNDAVNVEVEL
jgi:glycosyltransferase involved in cell wall biosynthesis